MHKRQIQIWQQVAKQTLKQTLAQVYNPTAGDTVPGFQSSVQVFRADQKTAHHSQTQRLKPNSHYRWAVRDFINNII